jgi:hypothetical protein
MEQMAREIMRRRTMKKKPNRIPSQENHRIRRKRLVAFSTKHRDVLISDIIGLIIKAILYF